MTRRTWLVALLVPLTLVVAVAGALLFATTTTAGLRLVARLAQPLVPGELAWETLDGRLIGPLRVAGLRWHDGDTTVALGEIALEWQPRRLARSHLHFGSIEARDVLVELPPAAAEPRPEAGPLRLPELPLTITAENVAIADVRIVRGTTTIPIASLAVTAQVDAERYRVDSLTLVAEPMDVSGTAEFGLQQPHAISADLAWQARLQPFGRDAVVDGRLEARGDLERLSYEIATSGDLDARLTGEASEPTAAARLSGRLELDAISAELAGFDTTGASAQVDFELDAEAAALQGTVAAPAYAPRPVSVALRARSVDGVVAVERLTVAPVDTAMTATASGTFDPNTISYDLQLEWSQLQWPLAGAATIASASGNATLRGERERFATELEAAFAFAPAPAAQVSARARGTADRIDVDRLVARFEEGGSVEAAGVLRVEEHPSARLDVRATSLQIERFVPQTSGRLGFDALVDIALPPAGAQIDVNLRRLDGRLRGQPLDGRGRVRLADGAIVVNTLELDAGQARLRADGRVADRLDLRWSLAVPDLALLFADTAGSLRSSGTATGTRARPALEGSLSAADLRIAMIEASTIESDFRIGPEPASPAELRLESTALRVGDLALGTVDLRSSGTVAAHEASVAIDAELGALRARFSGGLDNRDWRGELAALSVTRTDLGQWTLAAPASLAFGPGGLALGESCLRREGAGLCLSGDYSASAPWRAGFTLEDVPLAFLAPFLPPGLSYEGSLSGSGRVASVDGRPAGEAELRLSPGRVVTRTEDEDEVLIGFEQGSVTAVFDALAADTRIELDLRDTGLVNAQLRVPLAADGALDGQVHARVENLGIVPALLPYVASVDGRIEARLAVAGTRRAPELSGELALEAQSLTMPEFGITLQQVRADLITRDNLLRFDGLARSGDGEVRIDGDLAWVQGAPRGTIQLTGERFRAIDLPELWLDATPDLAIAIEDREIKVQGEVVVPAARITPIDIDTGIGVSSDQVIVGADTPDAAEADWRINGRVRVTAGDAVTIKGFGLQGRLTGSVLVIDRPGQTTIGRGALEIVDGEYRAYGQELTIETGRLEFTGGPIDDPGLDLRATRDAGDVVAGVQVRGALRAPVLDIFTVPPQSDTQSMSYLITGRGLEELNASDQLQVSDAATKLALQGGSLLAASVGRGLGLDSVGLEDEGTTASTSLVIGKHLSPRLFVSYGIGLFDAINTLRLRYQINPRLTLETESGARTSADLLYSFER